MRRLHIIAAVALAGCCLSACKTMTQDQCSKVIADVQAKRAAVQVAQAAVAAACSVATGGEISKACAKEIKAAAQAHAAVDLAIAAGVAACATLPLHVPPAPAAAPPVSPGVPI